ncbi:MAG: phosphotriesterase family protein [Thermoguttaceae bacterium]
MPSQPPAKESFVRTVLGEIPALELGFTHCHEHTFILPGRSSEIDPNFLLDDLDKTTAELCLFHAIDGRSLVDSQGISQERAPKLQQEASRRSRVNIIACTGFQRGRYYRPEHFCFRESSESLAARMIEEITEGMSIYQDSQVIEKTDVRAGVIRFASDYHLIDDNAKKVAEAVAAAHLATGAPILSHCQYGTCALEQIELFSKLGVHPSALLLSHLDRNLDFYVHQDVADAGAYMVYDGISRVDYHSDMEIIELMRWMLEEGFSRQILLGMDMQPRSMWKSYGGGPGMDYIGKTFLLKLRRAGLTHEPIEAFTNRNPSEALAFRKYS